MKNPMFNEKQFKLGFFAANCAGGMAVTQLPERWKASWENNLKLAQLADRARSLDWLRWSH